MNISSVQYLEDLQLKRVSPSEVAGIWQCSLPWPCGEAGRNNASMDGQPGSSLPLGTWHGSEAENDPRRLLISADGGSDSAPDAVTFSSAGKPAFKQSIQVRSHTFQYSPDPTSIWKRDYLLLDSGEKRIGLALGMRKRDGQISWWEFTGLESQGEDEFCQYWEMGGVIPFVENRKGDFKGFENPFLHKHNWLNGTLTVRAYANGVIEVFARHVNSRFVDAGGDCDDGVPVIGFFSENLEETWAGESLWEGDKEELTVAGVPFDIRKIAPLASARKPGRFQRGDGFLAWQPYEGCELYGGGPTKDRKGGGFIVRSEEGKILKGMSRTLHFSLSLSNRSPRIARYLPPYWWYGINEELGGKSFWPAPGVLIPWDKEAQAWRDLSIETSGYEYGNLPRAVNIPADQKPPEGERREPGWEGEIPWGFTMLAYRTRNPRDYETAVASSWYFHDVIVEHGDKQVRMHGYPPPAVSLPMVRVLCCVGLYLEHGYRHALETAEATVEAAWRVHRNSWPRYAVGRDATFGRSALMLYRYTNNRHFLKIGKGVAETVRQVQLPHGPFGDQGGGACIHGWSGYVVKPWMGAMATNVVLDYLELFPEEEESFWEVIRKYVDWLLRERWSRDGGDRTWSYQHEFADTRLYIEKGSPNPILLPSQGSRWHHENVGRLLMMAAERFEDTEYAEAWAESHRGLGRDRYLDQSMSATLQMLPGVEARLVQISAGDTGYSVKLDVPKALSVPEKITVEVPDGKLRIDTRSGKATLSTV